MDQEPVRLSTRGQWRNHGEAWPAEIIGFLTGFLPLRIPPNFQLVADEMERPHGFKRARSTLEDHVKNHLAHLNPQPFSFQWTIQAAR